MKICICNIENPKYIVIIEIGEIFPQNAESYCSYILKGRKNMTKSADLFFSLLKKNNLEQFGDFVTLRN